MRRVAGVLLLGLWTIPGLLSTTQIYVEEVMGGEQAYSVASILWYTLPIWWAWIPLTLAVVALTRRFPITASGRVPSLTVHGASCVGIGVLHLAVAAVWGSLAAPYDGTSVFTQFVERTVVDDTRMLANLFIYWLIVGGVHALDHYHESQRRALHASRLEAQLKSAQLDVLRAQLRPHFLFNTLSAIQTVTLRNDDHQSAQMIARLSDFLRTMLADRNTNVIPLADELAFVDQYVAIEKCRFADRLSVETDIDPAVKSVPVPTLVLQPLVENAIRHGIAPKEGPGRVAIKAGPDGGTLVLHVADDGVGATANDVRQHGEGLSNTRERLQQLYGDHASLTLETAPGDGCVVTLRIPMDAPTEPLDTGDQLPTSEVHLAQH
jgi:signal transduction histidine kinase